jgi:hypothetical protein
VKQGLLWYDNDPEHTLADKVKYAAKRYLTKYGRPANVCYVNTGELIDPPVVAGVRIEPRPFVLPYHLWIGIAPLDTP